MNIPRMRVLAGPNGSGKTSLAQTLMERALLTRESFVNADELKAAIDRGERLTLPFGKTLNDLREHVFSTSYDNDVKNFFSETTTEERGSLIFKEPVSSYVAAAIADFLRTAYLSACKSFSFETVFSHPSKADFVKKANHAGFRTYLYIVATDNVEVNLARIETRVQIGGHEVPAEKTKARYDRCLRLLAESVDLFRRVYFFDNTGEMNLLGNITPERCLELNSEKLPRWFQKYFL